MHIPPTFVATVVELDPYTGAQRSGTTVTMTHPLLDPLPPFELNREALVRLVSDFARANGRTYGVWFPSRLGETPAPVRAPDWTTG